MCLISEKHLVVDFPKSCLFVIKAVLDHEVAQYLHTKRL